MITQDTNLTRTTFHLLSPHPKSMRAVLHTASVEPCLLRWTAARALRDEGIKRWLIYDRVGAFLLK